MYKDCLSYQYTVSSYKKRKLNNLTVEEKIDLAEDIFIKKDYHENICAWYNVTRETIKTLIRNLEKDPSYLRKTLTKVQDKKEADESILL